MTFKKLALATAIACVPMASFAVDVLDDQDLAESTGQDGITVLINTGGITTDVIVHDKNGFAFDSYAAATGFTTAGVTSDNAYSFGGAILIDGMSIGAGNASDIQLDIDAGDDSAAAAGNAPILNVKVTLPAALTIVTGSIHVANSERDNTVATSTSWGISATSSAIMNSMTIVLGNATMNIQLGGEAQQGLRAGSDMIVLGGRIGGGLTISNFALNDANGGSIAVDTISVTNTGGTDLDLLVDVNVVAGGLQIETGQVGDVTNGLEVNMAGVSLGTAQPDIGDVSLRGLNLNNTTITVRGH